MPLTIEQLTARMQPSRTALLFGAGASIPSGAPSGPNLAHLLWDEVGKSEAQSDDLIETSSILSRRFGRRAVVDAIVKALNRLEPTGGMLALPKFPWRAIYSTNFDQLVEKAYKRSGASLTTIRSNYDLSAAETQPDPRLYKIHGCITQDVSLGHKGSLILTEQDYDEFDKYRQALFTSLEGALLTGDVLIVGQSLSDTHLQAQIKRVLRFKDQGAPGQIFILVFNEDDLRAPLWEDRGAQVVFGGIDQLLHSLAEGYVESRSEADLTEKTLPIKLVSSVFDVFSSRSLAPDVERMFHGGPASYADIEAGATFERTEGAQVEDAIGRSITPFFAIIGSAGVGKTTMARRVMVRLSKMGIATYEHRSDFVFDASQWIAYETTLRTGGERAVLLIDECTRHLRQVNTLIDHLATIKDRALSVILTANAAQWAPRVKSSHLFSLGKIIELTRLNNSEINSLLNLLQVNNKIASLVDKDFKLRNRTDQFSRLREKCGADMFVCLANIFTNDSLDQILLKEFADLSEPLQDVYRYVCALEAVGTRVHRQLLMRMTSLRADQVAGMLDGLTGIVDEFDIKPAAGIFGLTTRHIVIARKITDYKFSSVVELQHLFERIIDNLNPSVPLELQSVRDLCDTEFGIGRLPDKELRKTLYRKLIDVAPAERIPWHRLVREVLEDDPSAEAEFLIRNAMEAVGKDAPLRRYQVKMYVARSERLQGISDQDRIALLRKAYELADQNVRLHPLDKHSFRTLCEVGVKLVQWNEAEDYLNSALAQMIAAADTILDPDMERNIKHFEDLRRRLR